MSKEMVFNPITGIFDLVGIHEPKQIEVVLTEVTTILEIDVTSLGIMEGASFGIYADMIFVDSLMQPGGSRPRLTINNIITNDYYYAASNATNFQPDGSNSHINSQIYLGAILNGTIILSFSSNRVSNTNIITSSVTNLVIRNNNIQQLNFLTFAKSSADNYAPGSRFIITKLN